MDYKNKTINPEVLEKAFENIFTAMETIDLYRKTHLAQIQKNVEELNKALDKVKKTLEERHQESLKNYPESNSMATAMYDAFQNVYTTNQKHIKDTALSNIQKTRQSFTSSDENTNHIKQKKN